MPPVFFDSAQAFRIWLQAHHASASELVVGFRKVATGKPNMSWSESVDEALCFGWIDGVRKRIDDASYQIRFTPRRTGSIWSLVNVRKVQALVAQGRMHPAGLAAFEARRPEKTGIYAFERQQAAELVADEVRAFKKSPGAWTWFQATPPGYRKVITHWVTSAKRAETRARRLDQLIQACAGQRRIV